MIDHFEVVRKLNEALFEKTEDHVFSLSTNGLNYTIDFDGYHMWCDIDCGGECKTNQEVIDFVKESYKQWIKELQAVQLD